MQQIPLLMQHLLSGDLMALQDDFSMFYLASDANSTELWTLGLLAKDPRLQQALGKLTIQGQEDKKFFTFNSLFISEGNNPFFFAFKGFLLGRIKLCK